MPVLLTGAKLTIIITVFGLLIGFLLGVTTGLAKASRSTINEGLPTKQSIRKDFRSFRNFGSLVRYIISWALPKLAGVYIESIRGTPLMVQVMFLYFGLPLALGMRVPPLAAGIVAIAVNAGAYIAEIVRGAIQSIDKGQAEAGRSIGMSHFQTMFYIIWPQAFKRMIPPLGNQFIISLKDTSLLVVIGVGELTRQGQEIIAVNFRSFEVWLTVALMYLAMTMVIARVLSYVEKKLALKS